ncbi:hypothetical protein MXB_2357, partial [Myxobolus squamalis]
KVLTIPNGPTLEFNIEKFTLMKDICKFSNDPRISDKFFEYPALVHNLILNNIDTKTQSDKMIVTTFKNLFPLINVKNAKLSRIRRCVILNKIKDSDLIEFRH